MMEVSRRFRYSVFNDGVEQWTLDGIKNGDIELGDDFFFALERVRDGRHKARRSWCLVQRGEQGGDGMYGRLVAGPFASLDEAMDAFIVFLSLKGVFKDE